jgi:hypothetical protein
MDDDKTLKLDSALSSAFNVVPSISDASLKSQIISDTVIPEDSSMEADAEQVRSTLYNLLKEGEEAFGDLKRIAVAEESPRSFEVLNGMLSNLSDIAVKLLEVHERKQKMKKVSASQDAAPVNNGTVNNNTVFVGTTADLHDIIKKINME